MKLTADDLFIDPVIFHFGMKEKDPFESIRFFSKKKPDKAFKIPLKKISSLLPGEFQEKVVRVYCKHDSEVHIEEAERYVQ